MPKAEAVTNKDGVVIGHTIFCPACGHCHLFYNEQAGQSAKWTFNGDLEKPTFSPSMLVFHPTKDGGREHVCHSFVRDGQIQYLNDCHHEMAGQTVDLPDID